MRRWTVLVIAVSIVAAADVVGAQDPEDPDDVVAAMVDASPYLPISRLGRWDGTSFVPVGSASIDTPSVIVATHGWEPGLLAAYERLQAEQDALVTVWDPELVDQDGKSALTNLGPLVAALGRAEPEATILVFSWVDQSATADDPFDARQGEDATEINGHRLAVALDQALADGWDGELHIVGHSFGANVATTAALSVDAPPRQLTLMDSPDVELVRLGGAGNDLRYKLPRLDVGRGDDQTFVDNYISEVGIRYGDLPGLDAIVDVGLRPPDGSDFGARHEYPMVWYSQYLAGGPASPPTGPWWSPLLGGAPSTVGAYYIAEDDADPTRLTEIEGVPLAGIDDAVASPAVALELAGAGSAITVGGSTAVVDAAFTTSEDSLLLEFDVAFEGSADGATLTVGVDGRARYTAVGPGDGTGRPGSFVLLWDVEPGDHTLTVALTGGGAGATATLTKLRVVEATDIVRDDTEEQTTALVVTVLVVAALVVIAVLVGIVLVVRWLVRSRRTRRRSAAPPAR